MKAVKHVTNTWLVALHLFPVVCLIFLRFAKDEVALEIVLLFAFFGMLASLPALAICYLLFIAIMKTSVTGYVKLCFWMLAVTIAISIGAVFLCVLFGIGFSWLDLPILGCAVVAALLAILLRTSHFFQYEINQTKSYAKKLG